MVSSLLQVFLMMMMVTFAVQDCAAQRSCKPFGAECEARGKECCSGVCIVGKTRKDPNYCDVPKCSPLLGPCNNDGECCVRLGPTVPVKKRAGSRQRKRVGLVHFPGLSNPFPTDVDTSSDADPGPDVQVPSFLFATCKNFICVEKRTCKAVGSECDPPGDNDECCSRNCVYGRTKKDPNTCGDSPFCSPPLGPCDSDADCCNFISLMDPVQADSILTCSDSVCSYPLT